MTKQEIIETIEKLITSKTDDVQYMDSESKDCYDTEREIEALKIMLNTYQETT